MVARRAVRTRSIRTRTAPNLSVTRPCCWLEAAPTFVSRDRAAGARHIEDSGGASVIVMDDGLQNPALAKTLTLAVMDSARGVGNGLVVPAGPLRAPLNFQLGLVDAVVINGSGSSSASALRDFSGPRLGVSTVPSGDTAWLRDGAILAFAGIANPQRFFGLLTSLGAQMIDTVVFADHMPLTEADASRLLERVDQSGAMLVTTEKDTARMTRKQNSRRLWRFALVRGHSQFTSVLPMTMKPAFASS